MVVVPRAFHVGQIGTWAAGITVWRPKLGAWGAALCAMGIRARRTARHPRLRHCRLYPHHMAPVSESLVSPAIIGALGISSLLVLLFVRVPASAALTLVGFTGNFKLSGLHVALRLAGTSAFAMPSAY